MLPFILTGLAGIALGIVGLRLFQMRPYASVDAAKVAATPECNGETASAPGTNRNLLIGAGALGLVAVAVLALRTGGDESGSTKAIAGSDAIGATSNGTSQPDVDTAIANLEAKLQKDPQNGEGWRMLGWSYAMTGHAEKAIAPYKKALALLPNNASTQAGYGEALTKIAGNTVTAEAKGAFDKALSIDPQEPRARYFHGMWLAQNGKEREALDKWVALANSGPTDAPWQAEVRGQIAEVSKKLGVDGSSRLKPAPHISGPDAAAVAAAGQLPEGQRAAMVDGMVEGLAAKLKANPKNVDGWIMLLRSRMKLGQNQQAGTDLAIARKALASDAAALDKVNGAATEFGVPGAR